MDSMAEAIGVSVSVLRFIPCFVATIPLGFVWSLLRRHRCSSLPPLFWFLFQCPFLGSHVTGFRFHGPLSPPMWGYHLLIGIWLPHCLIRSSEANGPSSPSPSPYGATIRVLLQASFSMAMYLYLAPHFPLSRFNDHIYQEWGLWRRLCYQHMSCFTERWKYYFIWLISEASIIISGLGFSGWTESSPPKLRWDRAKNIDILGIELAESAVLLPFAWNIHVSTWLRRYVYERLIEEGKKPGFFQLLATQIISAIWHGVDPGYIIFFVQSALMIAGSRVIYRWQQAVTPKMALVKKVFVFMNFVYSLLVLSLHETLASYGSVYFIGTILPVVLILLGFEVKPGQ